MATLQNRHMPPPTRVKKVKRKLSLNSVATNAGDSRDQALVKTLLNPVGTLPSEKTSRQQEMEAHLLEIQAEIANRQERLNSREKQLEMRERDLRESEALLSARSKVLESRNTKSPFGEHPVVSDEEREAIEVLKRELDAQGKTLQHTRKMLHDREIYVEQCENELVEKSLILTEREARIEQVEEESNMRRNKRLKRPA